MENTPNPDSGEKQSKEFRLFAAKRILLGAIGIVLLLWLVSYALSFFDTPASEETDHTARVADVTSSHDDATQESPADTTDHAQTAPHEGPVDTTDNTQTAPPAGNDEARVEAHGETEPMDHGQTPSHTSDSATGMAAHTPPETTAPVTDTHAATAPPVETDRQSAAVEHETPGNHTAQVGHAAQSAAKEASHAPAGHAAFSASGVTGVAFVDATIAPLRYELEERYYGWRPNDIVDVTDNVNNYQLGVLEVTRRTVEVLLERISSTGGSQTFDKDLETARNNLMINASDYMLPSAEDSYEEALDSLKNYRGKLMNGTAFFYGRIDNLIPLLRAYENLLGSCDDKLIKHYEDDGSEVSWFQADDYFYYAKGVASAMHSILEAVAVDFDTAIETRRGTEILHHTLEALHHATQIDPILILDSAPDGILANHRANMAAPISHARFFVGLLIETLST
jgi:hypothetical protein